MNKLNAIIIEDDFLWSWPFLVSSSNGHCLFYSENKITFAVTQKGQEHIINLSLNKQMEQLASEQFFRANR